MVFLIMATHVDTAQSKKMTPQIQNDDPSSMLRNTGFSGSGLCNWRDNRNTSACCIQHTALVEKALNSQHRGPNPLLGLEQNHQCPECGMQCGRTPGHALPQPAQTPPCNNAESRWSRSVTLIHMALSSLKVGLDVESTTACGPVCAAPPKNCPPSANGTAKYELSLMKCGVLWGLLGCTLFGVPL